MNFVVRAQWTPSNVSKRNKNKQNSYGGKDFTPTSSSNNDDSIASESSDGNRKKKSKFDSSLSSSSSSDQIQYLGEISSLLHNNKKKNKQKNSQQNKNQEVFYVLFNLFFKILSTLEFLINVVLSFI